MYAQTQIQLQILQAMDAVPTLLILHSVAPLMMASALSQQLYAVLAAEDQLLAQLLETFATQASIAQKVHPHKHHVQEAHTRQELDRTNAKIVQKASTALQDVQYLFCVRVVSAHQRAKRQLSVWMVHTAVPISQRWFRTTTAHSVRTPSTASTVSFKVLAIPVTTVISEQLPQETQLRFVLWVTTVLLEPNFQ